MDHAPDKRVTIGEWGDKYPNNGVFPAAFAGASCGALAIRGREHGASYACGRKRRKHGRALFAQY